MLAPLTCSRSTLLVWSLKRTVKPLTGSGEPSFKVELFGCCVVQRTRHNVDNPVGDVESLIEGFSIANHLIHHLPRFIVMRRSDAKLFDLFEYKTEVSNRDKSL